MPVITPPPVSTYPLWYLQHGIITLAEYNEIRSMRYWPRLPAEPWRLEQWKERWMTRHRLTWCRKHGYQRVTEYGTFTGFAGGCCSYTAAACGCWTDVDESADVRAAR